MIRPSSAGFLIFSAVVVVFSMIFVRAQGPSYHENYCGISTYLYRPPEDYPYASNSLQIFSSPMVACDGMLVGWRFLALTNKIFNLNLAVFRLNPNKTAFTIMHVTRVNLNLDRASDIWGYNATQTWISVNAPRPGRVRRGDFIGIFYDDIQNSNEVIGTRPVEPVADKDDVDYIVYEYYRDSSTLLRQTIDNSSFLTEVELSEALQIRLIPALIPLVQERGAKPAWKASVNQLQIVAHNENNDDISDYNNNKFEIIAGSGADSTLPFTAAPFLFSLILAAFISLKFALN